MKHFLKIGFVQKTKTSRPEISILKIDGNSSGVETPPIFRN